MEVFSDGGAYPPESCVFGWFLNMSALFCRCAHLVFSADYSAYNDIIVIL